MKTRAPRYWSLMLVVAALGCVDGPGVTHPAPSRPPPPPPSPSPIADVRLRDVVIPSLPSPYYRFEYDSSGSVTFASFASDLRTYDVQYEGDRIIGMQSTGFSTERLTYFYDGTGKVSMVTYTDRAGDVYVRIHLAYAGKQLVRLERERRVGVGGSFQVDKRLSFVYDGDGNLAEFIDERLPFPGQTVATFVDRFEQYDAGINVDGFSLVHNEFFDHLVLLPAVRLQLGNPAGVTRTGDGLNYHIDYTYTYDGEDRPLTKHGEGIFLNGPGAGARFQTNAAFSYQ